MARPAQRLAKYIDAPMDRSTATVFSNRRAICAPEIKLPPDLKLNTRLKMNGLDFLAKLPSNAIPVAFFDPQYRGVLDKLSYGNEGERRGRRRHELQQMTEAVICRFIEGIDRVLLPSGHLFLWVDKFHLVHGLKAWFDSTSLDAVDMLTWDKETFGMGYRTRRQAEYCVVLQKQPRRAKGVWKIHNIPDVVQEVITSALKREHPHAKPINLQADLMEAVSNKGDLVIDPAAGSFSVLEAAQERCRNFLGCDLEG